MWDEHETMAGKVADCTATSPAHVVRDPAYWNGR